MANEKKYQVTVTAREGKYETRNDLKIFHNGVEIQSESDYGEPEDNSFYRDWSWVADALEKAYELGFQDGKLNE